MKDMISKNNISKTDLYVNWYDNGQIALYLRGVGGEPIAEISINYEGIDLEENEFILKDYNENETLIPQLFDSGKVIPTDRFILVGSHICPICKLNIP
jgi:hypothetical protein